MLNFTRVKKHIQQGVGVAAIVLPAVMLTACASEDADILNTGQTYTDGYVLDRDALDSIAVGSSRDQVLLALGSPSMTALYDNEVFYYISQTRYRGAEFLKSTIVDRKILAIYFSKQGRIAKIAHYGLQDGKIFDFISRTTPTSGRDQTFLNQLFSGKNFLQGMLPKTSR